METKERGIYKGEEDILTVLSGTVSEKTLGLSRLRK